MNAKELEKLLSEVTPGEWVIGVESEVYADGECDMWQVVGVKDFEAIALVVNEGQKKDLTNTMNASLIAMAPTLARRVIAAEKLAEALQTSKDYVDDASRGKLRYLGMSDISEMAGDDLVFIQAALDEWDAAK